MDRSLTIERGFSRDRVPVGLIRCVCKDDQIKGPYAPVKFKLSNIHAFVSIWMAPSILKNFRLIAAQSSPLSDLGRLDYRVITPKEGKTGETLCGLQVHLSDTLVEFFHRDWPAIEASAKQGLLKPDVWRSRRTNLSIKAKVEIPVSGTAIQIQQQAFEVWDCTEGHINHPRRSTAPVTEQDKRRLYRSTPDQQEIDVGSNEFMECQFDHRDRSMSGPGPGTSTGTSVAHARCLCSHSPWRIQKLYCEGYRLVLFCASAIWGMSPGRCINHPKIRDTPHDRRHPTVTSRHACSQ